MLFIACGRIKAGKSEMRFDRKHFEKEGLQRHLTDEEFGRIEGFLDHNCKPTEEEIEGYGMHIRVCRQCTERLLSIPSIVLDEESVHTSSPPQREGPNIIEVQDINSWDDQVIH